jgi:hypothetical protein
MAVVNAYVNSNVAAKNKVRPEVVAKAGVQALAITFETAAADDNNSIYRIARIPANWVPLSLQIIHDAVAGMTDVNIGFHRTLENGGAAAETDANILYDALDMSSAGYANGMLEIDPANIGKTVGELAGKTVLTQDEEYDLTLLAIAAASAAATVSVIATFAVNG